MLSVITVYFTFSFLFHLFIYSFFYSLSINSLFIYLCCFLFLLFCIRFIFSACTNDLLCSFGSLPNDTLLLHLDKLIVPCDAEWYHRTWVICGSCNGLSPFQCQAITWTNDDLFSLRLWGTHFNEIKIQKKIIAIMHLKKWFAKRRLF